jgi:hypothetical protein
MELHYVTFSTFLLLALSFFGPISPLSILFSNTHNIGYVISRMRDQNSFRTICLGFQLCETSVSLECQGEEYGGSCLLAYVSLPFTPQIRPQLRGVF